MRLRTSALVLLTLILASGLSACSGSGTGNGQLDRVTLAVYPGAESGLVYMAREQGFFADNGLEVVFEEYESGKLAADGLLAGKADLATAADFVATSNSIERDDLRIVGTIASSNGIELVARKDRGISQPSDLEGMKIGVVRGSASEFFLGSFLTFNGIHIDDVVLVDLSPSDIAKAVISGEIDAGISWNPNVYNMKNALGSNAVSWPGQSSQEYFFLLLTTEKFVTEKTSAVERFMSAVVAAEERFGESVEDSKIFVGQMFSHDDAYIESIWHQIDYEVILPQSLILIMEDQTRWRLRVGLTDVEQMPNYLDYVYFDALEAARPDAVTIIR